MHAESVINTTTRPRPAKLTYLRVVKSVRENGHVILRLLRGLLGCLGGPLRLLQLLQLAFERLACFDVLLFQTLEQHLFAGQRSLFSDSEIG